VCVVRRRAGLNSGWRDSSWMSFSSESGGSAIHARLAASLLAVPGLILTLGRAYMMRTRERGVE
jgi:hypothetical protein